MSKDGPSYTLDQQFLNLRLEQAGFM